MTPTEYKGYKTMTPTELIKDKLSDATGLDGVDLLRDAVVFLNNRAEALNENKPPAQLLAEYLEYKYEIGMT